MRNTGNSSSQSITRPFAIGQEFKDPGANIPGDPSILIVTEIDELKVNYINNMVDDYCGVAPENFHKGKLCFYKELLHPEDYPNYLIHLNCCKELQNGEEKEIVIRLKEKDGNWRKFCFKDKLYKWASKEGIPTVLTLANVLPGPDGPKSEKISCEDANAEEDLHHNQYKDLLHSIDEAFCILEMIFDSEGEPVDYLFTETNPAFEKHINLQNARGKTMRELIPEHEQFWFRTYGKVAVTGKSVRFQEKAANLNNSWLDLYAYRIGDENSRKVAVLFHNITQQKLAEEQLIKTQGELEKIAKQSQQELIENNQLLQTVFDTTNLAIAVFQTLYDQNGEIKDFLFIRVNKVLREMYLEVDLLGSTYTETSKIGVELGIFDKFKEVIKTGENLDQEFYFNKQRFNNWFRITGRRQNDLLIVSIEDITAEKAEAQKHKETLRFNKQLIKTSPDTILIINLNDNRVRFINQDILKNAGMTRKKVKGMTLKEILLHLHPRDREKTVNFHTKILKSPRNEIQDLEIRVKTIGSHWEWFHIRGKIFSRKNKNWVDEYVLLVRNITEQKNIQKALIQAEKLSIQGELARTFAHDLRNPLASIRIAVDVMKNKLEEPEKKSLENYFGILSRSTKTLNDLVNTLLNSANYSPAVLKKIDLAEIVDQTLEQAADRIYLTGIKVIKKYNGPYNIQGDQEKLKIALLNIVVNASEATNPDEGIIELEIKKHKTDFMLSITDNGHGIEKEKQHQLFNAFYTSKSSGVGIGLSSVKNILEEHDAQIEVKSNLNEGTTFTILFQNPEMS